MQVVVVVLGKEDPFGGDLLLLSYSGRQIKSCVCTKNAMRSDQLLPNPLVMSMLKDCAVRRDQIDLQRYTKLCGCHG